MKTKIFKKVKLFMTNIFYKFKKIEVKIVEKIESLEKEIYFVNEEVEKIDDKIKKINENYYTINKKLDYLKEIHNYTGIEMISLNNINSKKKKILLCGFYGAFNLGDEIMLSKMLETLQSKGDFDITIMLCDNPYTDITRYGKYKFIHYPKTISDLNHIANYFDCLIFSGGALIDDINYDNFEPQMTLGYILINLTLRFITFDKKTILYGLSTNKKLENSEFIKKLDYIINNCTYFSLRDTNSLKILKNLNIDTSKINIVNDIAFAYDYQIESKKIDKKINIGIIYIINDDTIDDLYKNTDNLLNYLENNKIKYNINFIPFYDYLGSDYKFYLQMKEKYNNENIKVVNYEYKFNEVLKLFNEQDLIISMRYHGSLIANMLNKKNVSILYKQHRHYENKINYLYEHYNFGKNICFELNKKSLDLLFNDKTKIDKEKLKEITIEANSELNEALKFIE